MTSSVSHFMVNFVIDYAVGKSLLVQNPVLKTHLPSNLHSQDLVPSHPSVWEI